MGEWGPEREPWLRFESRARGEAERDEGLAQCYFCGERSVKRSFGDYAEDNGRLEVYCTNESCEAREVVVLVVRDSYSASDRADVRVLSAIDEDSHSSARPPVVVHTVSEFLDRTVSDSAIVERRQSTEPIEVAAWGPGEARER